MEKSNHKDTKCGSCGKSFSHAHNLKNHIHSVHQVPKNYKCEACGKSFSQNERIHEGCKDFKCQSCNKLFSTAQYLKRNILTIQEGHKDYKC